jgi:hypothetical protein
MSTCLQSPGEVCVGPEGAVGEEGREQGQGRTVPGQGMGAVKESASVSALIQGAVCGRVCPSRLQVVRLGFDRNKLVESIRTRQQNEASITYWLLLDNRRRMPSSGYLAHEMAEAVAAANASFLGQPGGKCSC